MMDDQAVEVTKEWLSRKGVTLWGTFDVSDDAGRTKAATWLVEELDSLMDFVEGGPE